MKRNSDRVAADPDETITFVESAPLRLRGGWLLCVAAGAALVAQHVLTGLLATPFFGSEAFFWGNILGTFVLSTGLGLGAGDRLSVLAGCAARAPFRLAALGGALVVLGTWALPLVARRILDRDPDSPLAPLETFGLVLAAPGVVLAAVVPAVVRALAEENGRSTTPFALARTALRRFSLAMLGGLGGLALASWGLLHAETGHVWAQLYGLGAGLIVLGAVGLSSAERVLALVVVAGLAGLVLGKKSEIQDPELQAALTEGVLLRGSGRYYARTAPPHVLSGTELERRLGVARMRLQGADKEIAVLLVVETVKTLGPINISGTGLKGLLDIYLPRESKPLVLPFVDQVDELRSDGRRFHFKIHRSTDGCAHFRLPQKDSKDDQEFTITRDFDMTVTTEESRDEQVTRFEIGPQEKTEGLLNDTVVTPFVCKNVALWIDAHLLGVTIRNRKDDVVLEAVAQASVGGVQTRVLQRIEKVPPRDQ